jgi:hypothetical protein
MRRAIQLLPVFAAAAAFAACDNTTTSAGPGRLTVLLTDAPFSTADVESATIYVRRIDCQQASTTSEEAEDEQSRGWTTVVSPDHAIDLLPLNNGVTVDLGTQTLPSGSWQSCRIVIDPAQSYVELTDGSRPDIKWPSAGRSGIKVRLNEPVTVDDNSVLVLDFDIGSSFVLRGNDIHNNGLLFKPVVHGVIRDVAATLSGSVHGGTVDGEAIAGATVQLLPPGTALTDETTAALRTTSTDAAGAFSFHFVVPGTYTLRAIPPTGSAYKSALFSSDVTVTANENETGDVIVLTK